MNIEHANRASRRTARRAGAIAGIALLPLLCAQAQTQSVQKCRIDGRIVFQSSPCPPEPRAATTAPQAVAADASGVPSKKTLAERLRERDAADHTRPASREPQSDGASVLRSRMGAL